MRALGLAFGALALASCAKETRDPVAEATASAAAEGKTADVVPCAIRNEKPKDCARDIAEGPDGPIWIIRRSDGGFRRFVLIDNGTRIATADGADEVRTKRNPGFLEVFVADEYYRFPDAAPNCPKPG
jgi:hypothetical protein